MRDQRTERSFAVAAVIQSIPPAFTYFIVAWVSVFMLVAMGLNFSQLPVFFAHVLFWCQVLTIIAGVCGLVAIGLWCSHVYHDVIMKANERKGAREKVKKLFLQNEVLAAKIDVHRQLPSLVIHAMDSGKNFEFDGLKITDWKSHVATLQSGTSALQISAPNIILPSKSEMIEVARRHDFSRDNIFLAQSGTGDVTTTISGYVHAANDGSTGSGKTTNWRGQMVQFVKADIGCVLLNPHFSLRTKAGDDWKPIAKALESQGSYGMDMPRVVTQFANIGAVLEWMATVEIDRRFEMMRRECFDYDPLYCYIDEWPAIVSNCKEAPDYLRTILQRGRAVEVCVSVNSQGFLANDTDLKGSARENFDTAFFMGGSTYSGAKMLDLQEVKLKEMISNCQEPLGKGVAFLRNNSSCSEAQLVRLPYADNEFVYHCLGRADGYQLPPEKIVESETVGSDLATVYDAYVDLQEQGLNPSYRVLEERTGYGKDKVGKLLRQLKQQGKISD